MILKKAGFSGAVSPKYISTNLFDVDYGFAPVDGTWLDLGYTLITPQRYSSEYSSFAYKLARDLSNGHMLTLGFGEALLGGWNNTYVRYITGSTAFSGFGDGTWLQNNASSSTYTWDFLDFGNVRFTDRVLMYYHIRGTVNGGYDNVLTNLRKSKAFQLVVRPELQLTKMTKVAAEFGMYTKSDSYTDAKLNTNAQQQKATLAYVLCPDASAFYNRPEIRFFVTYKHAGHSVGEYASFKGDYNHVVKSDSGTLETVSYGRNRDNVTVFGVQADAWF
ncbi:MAG: carbohydrate porin [Succinatimonas sp.]|nr:carbohydrate porin [Succinatimonas sp.]